MSEVGNLNASKGANRAFPEFPFFPKLPIIVTSVGHLKREIIIDQYTTKHWFNKCFNIKFRLNVVSSVKLFFFYLPHTVDEQDFTVVNSIHSYKFTDKYFIWTCKTKEFLFNKLCQTERVFFRFIFIASFLLVPFWVYVYI